MDLMNDSGVTVWLDTPAECIFERLRRNRSRRPLIAGMTDGELRGFIAGALAEREPFYARAAHRFSGELLEDRRQIDVTVAGFVNMFIKNGLG